MAVTLELDGSVEKINAKLKSTTEALEGVAEGYENIDRASKEAVGGATTEQSKLKASVKKTTAEYELQGKTLRQLTAHLARLSEGQKKATDPALVKKYNTEIAKTRAAMASLKGTGVSGLTAINGAATGSKAIFTALKATIATTFAPLFAAGAAVAGITQIIGLVTDYEQTAADLQAITGANGDTLEFLKQSAVEVGLSTTVSAGKTLEAYKLIASAKPELLSNAEGLANITKEAIILNDAFGGDLPTTATNLTDIMNKFNAPADEARRYVNALAAGSKEGSADVGQLAAAFLGAGTDMASANVKFEEGVALFETLAEKGIKGSESGTALRNVLSKLSATEILPKDTLKRLEAAGVDITKLSDKSLSFTDRLRALAPIQNNANTLTSLFGLENKATAEILLQNIDRTDELTAAVTGSNVAYEQAEIRTKTAAAEFAKLKNTIQTLAIEGGNGLGGLLAFIISFVREGILFMRDRVRELKPTFDILTGAVSELFSTIQNLLPAQKSAADGVSIWTTVIKVLNVPIKILFALLTHGIKVINGVIQGFSGFIKVGPRLNAFFKNIKIGVTNFLSAFALLPAYISGGLAALRTFVSEAANSVGQLGRNIGKTLGEAFNIGKLIREGTGDLDAAVTKLLTNPFKGVGAKAAKAFEDAYYDAIFDGKTAKVPVEVEITEPTDDDTDTPTADAPKPFIDPDEVAKKAKEAAKAEEKAAKEAEKRAKDIVKTRLEAMADGRDKELALEELRFNDLMAKLEEYGLDSSEAIYQNELNKFNIKSKFLSNAADLEGLSGEERIKFLYEQTKAELDAIETALKEANGGEIVAEQAAQLNLLREKANNDYLTKIEELNSKEQIKAKNHEIALLELRRDEFKTAADFEEFKQREILNIRLKYAEAQLALLEKTKGAEDDAVLALKGTINSIKGEIEGLTKESNTAKEFSIFRLVGLDPDDPNNAGLIQGLETAAATTVDVLSQINDVRLQTAEDAIKASDEEIKAIDDKIQAKESELEEEKALAAEGFANNASAVEEEIALLQKQKAAEKVERDKALEEKKRIQKQQAIIDTITQGSSLITAAAQVFQSVAAIPFVGVPLAIGLVATMLGSFAAAKAKVFQNINTQKAEKGMTGTVRGRRHSNGGEKFGDHIEVEDGEAFGVLSRSATRKHGKFYNAFTNALNKGGGAKIVSLLGGFGRGLINRNLADDLGNKEAKVIQLRTEVNAKIDGKEQAENNRLMRAILKEQNRTKTTVEYRGDSKIIKTGNSTRIIKNRRKYG